ncbi:MAG: phosphodiester glycosidase family protein [Lachnospiraceae bacterium]|nr:phosphodiester glycosidase family protein [Lachnospiraceae bacterium]
MKKLVIRIIVVILTTVLFALFGLMTVLLIINYGPSDRAHKLFVNSVRETSAIGFLADWFTTPEELERILSENTIEEIDDVTDTSMVVIKNRDSESKKPDANVTPAGNTQESSTTDPNPAETGTPDNDTPTPEEEPAEPGVTENNLISDKDGIKICKVKGPTYTGRMMIIEDPSRVKVGVCKQFGIRSGRGQQVSQIMEAYNAVAATNAGGFEDDNGRGSGSMPIGYVFSEGQLLYNPKGSGLLIGFDENDILIVGNMTADQALEKKIRDAITFGPALIVNGVSAQISGVGSGLNPRTAIGQRGDGAVLLLSIDGRQANSLGATYGDMIKIYEEFGAVNAANLDGGSSAIMYYEGEVISNPSNMINNRNMPTAIIVTR